MTIPRLSPLTVTLALVGACLLSSCMLPPLPPDNTSPRHYVRVPQVMGQSLDQATQTLGRYQLRVGQVDYTASSYPEGTVIAQFPVRRSRVLTQSTVNLTVAAPTVQRTVLVPNLVGVDFETASDLLRDAGLRVGSTTGVRSDRYPEGTVYAQNPPAGRSVYRGTQVSLSVVRRVSHRLVTVPNVVGLDSATAQATVRRYGLTVSVNYVIYPSVTSGHVASQSPASGSRVPYQSSVTLNIARQGHPRQIYVPSVLGRSLESARQTLSQAGLTVGRVTYQDGAPYGAVRTQEPAPRSRVRAGSSVNLVVGRRSAPRTVSTPNVVGLPQERAREVIRDMGLTPGRVTYTSTSDPRVRDGQVLSQNPIPGRTVNRGTAVALTVARRQTPQIRVPLVVGLSLTQAKERIRTSGFAVGSVAYQVSRKVGLVLSQNPSPRTAAARGSRISLVVGKAANNPPANVVRVPGVLFKSEKEARKIIERAGLKVGHIKKVPGLPRKRVLAQYPLPGVRVARGTKVNLHVSR